MFHLRFTPYDISGYTFNFLNDFEKYIVAYEDRDKYGKSTVPHYHIAIETDYEKKSISDRAKEFLKIPPAGRGKNNKFYCLNDHWEDITYVCKYDDIRMSKGYTDSQLLNYAVEGKKKYLRFSEVPVENQRNESVVRIPYQQAVIADAAAKWYNYKREQAQTGEFVDKQTLVLFVCEAMRTVNKGINPYLVKELALAVLFDDLDYRDEVLKKIVL